MPQPHARPAPTAATRMASASTGSRRRRRGLGRLGHLTFVLCPVIGSSCSQSRVNHRRSHLPPDGIDNIGEILLLGALCTMLSTVRSVERLAFGARREDHGLTCCLCCRSGIDVPPHSAARPGLPLFALLIHETYVQPGSEAALAFGYPLRRPRPYQPAGRSG